MIGNRVANNVGGILVSDGGLNPTSVGPAAHNVIEFNTSTENLFDCGITLPSPRPAGRGYERTATTQARRRVRQPGRAQRVDGQRLFSAVVPITDTVVVGNLIANNTFGIWQTSNVQATGLTRNAFVNNQANVGVFPPPPPS